VNMTIANSWRKTTCLTALCGGALVALASGTVQAGDMSPSAPRQGNPVPTELRAGYQRALAYLVKVQGDDGGWGNHCGVSAICLMSLLATGEDPNFGPYAEPVRKAIRFLINRQDPNTGYIPNAMYDHGFATLALAECYGAVDDSLLWPNSKGRPLAKAVELAVRCAVTSQSNNPFNAWRYSPSGKDADTSVSGAVLMGLLGARNAGVEVPDKCIDGALEYYSSSTIETGNVAYTGFSALGASENRSAIATLVFAVAKRKDVPAYNHASKYVKESAETGIAPASFPEYYRYYTAQALFQADHDLWKRWNEENTKFILSYQGEDGSIIIPGAQGYLGYSTGMALLSSALTYCFLPIYER
jgi:prenyltransferase/squalene oxidase-like repeat protein